ncbi:tetratricopeptide repeat protein [Candidatus Poribacteria bacterium]|nr:tetratricopeptide repeat protein [Candidatus Poribacteria bacterium]
MNRIFSPYLWFIIVVYVFCNIAVPLWGFVSEGDGTRYTLETLDAATEDIEHAADGSYLIHSNITIANRKAPDRLTIAPGAILKFAPGVELRIKGTLISLGKKNNPIKFTSQKVKKWNGIVFDNALPTPPLTGGKRGGGNSIIKYSLVEKAQNGILADSSNVKIMQNEIRQISSAAISFWNASEGNIVGNTISEADIGIYCKKSSPKIEDNKLNGLNMGIFVKGRTLKSDTLPSTIKGNVISKSKNVAIILTDASKWQIEANQLIDNRCGIKCNNSDPTIKGNSITGGEYGIYCEEASPRIEGNNILNSTLADIQIISTEANVERPKADAPTEVAVVSDYGDDEKPLVEPKGKAQASRKEPKRKTKQLEKVIATPKATTNERIAAQFEAGRKHFKAGDYQQSLAFYDAIIKEFADKKKQKGVKRELANVYYHRGLTYYQLGKYAEAIDDCQSSIRLKPNSEVQLRAQYILAMSYMNMPKSDKQTAEQVFAEVVKFKPTDEEEQEIVALAYLQLGRIAMQREDYQGAIPKYQKAVEYFQKVQKPEDTSKIVEAIADVAYCYLQLKDYQAASVWYERLVSTAHLTPSLSTSGEGKGEVATGHLALGDIYAHDKKWDEAEKHYSTAIQYANTANWDDKLRGDIYFKLGESLLASGKREQAQNAYQEALQLNPDAQWQADAAYNIGEISFSKKDYKNAIVAYQRAITGYESAMGKLEDEELIERAKTRIALSKLQLAESYVNHASEGEYQKILQAYQEARRASRSLSDETLRSAIEKDALYGEGIFWQKLGQSEKSIEAASNLAEIATTKNDAMGLLQAADLLFEAAGNDENYPKAAEVYERALPLLGGAGVGKQESQGRVRLPPNPDEEYLRLTARLGFCYLRMSENAMAEGKNELLRKAIENYDAVLAKSKPNAELVDNARYHKAVAHKLLGEYDVAAKLFAEVIASQTISRKALVHSDLTSSDFGKASLLPLAEIYEQERKYDDAIITYETAYNTLTEPQNKALALQKLGELSRQQGRYDDAIRYYQELVRQFPQSEFAASAQYFIGLSYSSKPDAQDDDLNKACAAYETFIEKYSSSKFTLDVYWNLALLYDRLDQKAKAMDVCKQIIAKYQSSGDANIQPVVDAAQNMLSNILLDKMGAPPLSTGGAGGGLNVADAEMLKTQLKQITVSPTQAAVAKANAHFELGNIYLRAKDYQAALTEYDRAISYSPGEELLTKIYYHQILAHYELSEYAKVIATCQEVLKLNPTHPRPLPRGEVTPEIKAHLMYLLGVSFQALGQQPEAEEAFKTAIQLTQNLGNSEFGIRNLELKNSSLLSTSDFRLPTSGIAAQSHLRLGNLYNQQGRNQEAEQEYRQAAESGTPIIQAEAYHQIARLYELQQSDSANGKIIEMYSNILTVSTDDLLTAEALYKRGLLYTKQSQSEAAVKDFEELVKRFSKSQDNDIRAMVEDATFQLSNMYGKQGDIDAAIEKAKATESIAKQNGKPGALAQAQYQLASLYYKKAQTYEQTSKTYKQLIAQASRLYKSAYENATHPYPSQGGEAKKASDTDEKLQAISNAASFQAGQLAYQLDEFDGAITALTSFTEKFPNDPKSIAARNYLAWSYYQSAGGQKTDKQRKHLFIQSANAFEKLSQEFSDDERAAEWLYQAGQASTEAGEYNRAIAAYRRLADAYPAHKLADAALYSAANALRTIKQYDDAIKMYQAMLSKYPKSDWADESAYSVGICYDQRKQFDEAIVAYQAVIEKFKDSPLAANAQANIAHYYFNRKDYVRALDGYQKLTKANFSNIDDKLLQDAKSWVKDTENVLAESIYRQAVAAMSKAEDDKISKEQRKKYAQDALALFKQIKEKYPNSVYIDNATVSMGTTHEILEQWEEAIASYEIITKRYPKTPPTKEIETLIAYAQERIKTIQAYLWQKKKFE